MLIRVCVGDGFAWIKVFDSMTVLLDSLGCVSVGLTSGLCLARVGCILGFA